MTKFTATVQKLGRITIPNDVRKLRLVEEGDLVEVELVAVHKPHVEAPA